MHIAEAGEVIEPWLNHTPTPVQFTGQCSTFVDIMQRTVNVVRPMQQIVNCGRKATHRQFGEVIVITHTQLGIGIAQFANQLV